MRFRYIDNLYTDIDDEKKLRKKLKTLSKKKPDPAMFLVTYPLSNAGIMEIYSEAELMQPYYRKLKKYLNIIGVFSSKDKAKKMIPDILNDIIRETGKVDVYRFVKVHLKEFSEDVQGNED